MIKLTLSIAVLLFGASAIDQQHGIKQLALTKGKLPTGHNSAKNLAKIRASAGSKLKSKLSTGVVLPCEPHPDCEVTASDIATVVEDLAANMIETGELVGQNPEELREDVIEVVEATIAKLEDLHVNDAVVEELEATLEVLEEPVTGDWEPAEALEELKADLAETQAAAQQEDFVATVETTQTVVEAATEFFDEVTELVEKLEEQGASDAKIEAAVDNLVIEQIQNYADSLPSDTLEETY